MTRFPRFSFLQASFVQAVGLLALLLLAAPGAAQQKITAYRGARILPVGSAPIDQGVLVIAQGKVQAMGGPATPLPDGAEVVEVAGRTITPGLIDAAFAHGTTGNDENEQGAEVTPALRILDSLDPADRAFVQARSAGVTAVHVTPGNKNVIGGLGAVVKTAGVDPRTMVVRDETCLRMAMGAEPSMGNRAIRGGQVESIYYRRPTTRMGVVWEARKAFYDAKAALERTNAAPPEDDPDTQVLIRVLQKQLAVLTTARSEQDIRTALRLAAEFGYTTVLDEVQEAHYTIDEISAAKVTVIVGAPSADRVTGTGSQDGAQPRFGTLALLAARQVPFVIATGSNQAALDLVREAMFAVRNGLDAALALEAITLRPALLLGIADRLGSLAAGKDADFVVWSGDPFDPATTAEQVCIDGNPVHILR
jgi:imidazolonepropionase-like amidohydrolase